jgi:hypothetical protein
MTSDIRVKARRKERSQLSRPPLSRCSPPFIVQSALSELFTRLGTKQIVSWILKKKKKKMSCANTRKQTSKREI